MSFKSLANRSAALRLSQAKNSSLVEVISETLLMTSASWDGAAYPQYPACTPMISVLRISVPPHTVLAWHHHPIPAVGYLLSGELTIEKKDGNRQKTFICGEVIAEVVNSVHRGIAGAEPVELLVFYAGGVGVPLSVICEP